MNRVEAFAQFKVENDTLPCDSLGEMIGVRPDQCWRKGDRMGKSRLEHKTNGCIYKSKLAKSASVADHAKSLLETLRPAAVQISGLKKYNFQMLFSCVVYCSERPDLYFDRSLIASISKLGADFDIDIYFLPRDD